MKKGLTFYHYSKNIENIKKKDYISDASFSKTNTYDVLLETCPEILLSKKEIKRLKKYKPEKVRGYKSKYSKLKLKFKNRLLNEFFNHNNYVLAFDEKLPKGWIKLGMFQLLIYKVGGKYIKFNIDNTTAKKSFVLNQKYWSPKYSLKKFKLNTWEKGFRIEKHPKIVREVFGKYYLSIKRLPDYKKGEFETPEFWIYGRIPVNNCVLGKISKSLEDKYNKERWKIKNLKW